MAPRKKAVSKLQIVPLGGALEIGKNMTAYVYKDQILVVSSAEHERTRAIVQDSIKNEVVERGTVRLVTRPVAFAHEPLQRLVDPTSTTPDICFQGFEARRSCLVVEAEVAERRVQQLLQDHARLSICGAHALGCAYPAGRCGIGWLAQIGRVLERDSYSD